MAPTKIADYGALLKKSKKEPIESTLASIEKKDILCPSSSIEANQFVDSYVAKKTKFVEHHNKMPAPGNVKLLMDALHIQYADIRVELKMYTATGLIHKVLPGILAPYQMVWFLVEFNIINATI